MQDGGSAIAAAFEAWVSVVIQGCFPCKLESVRKGYMSFGEVKDWYSTNALDSRRRKFEFPLMIWVDQWGAGKYLARLWEVRGRRVVVIFK